MPSGVATPIAKSGLSFPATAALATIGSGNLNALVREVIWRAGAQPNYAEIELPEERFEALRSADVDDGVEIVIRDTTGEKRVFVGRISGRSAEYSPSGESVSLIALGPRLMLSRDFVAGQELDAFEFDPSGSDPSTTSPVVVTARPCVFNAGGKGNRLASPLLQFHPDPVRLIATSLNEWNIQDMVRYCYAQRLRTNRREFRGSTSEPAVDNLVGNPMEGQLKEALATTIVYGVDVEGQRINDAIHTAIDAAGHLWWLKPLRLDDEDGPVGELRTALRSYVDGESVVKTLALPAVTSGTLPGTAVDGPDISAGGANHNRGTLNEDYSQVVSDVLAQGAPTRFQFEVILLPGWRSTDEAAIAGGDVEGIRIETTEKSSSQWNPLEGDPGANYYRDVGRLWLLDESGGETDRPGRAPYDYSEAADFDGPIAAGMPRPFLNQLLNRVGLVDATSTKTQRAVSVKPKVTHPAEAGELESEISFALESERGGIRVLNPDIARRPFLDEATKTWATAVKLEVAVESDWLGAKYAANEDAVPRARTAVKGRRQYDTSEGTSIEAALQALADRRQAVLSQPIRSASFSIPWITTLYEPGDWITSIEGRGLSWIGQIVEVRLDFASQDTHLQLEDARIFLDAEGTGAEE